MVALTIPAASVRLISGPDAPDQVSGEAFIAGANLYQAVSGQWFKAKASGTVDEVGANNTGIALATADAAGARVSVALPGAIVQLGTGTAGVVYAIGAVAGQLVPMADLVATNRVHPVAVGIGLNQVQLARNYNAGAVL